MVIPRWNLPKQYGNLKFLEFENTQKNSKKAATLLKSDSSTGAFLWILRDFGEYLFSKAYANGCL